MRDFLRRLLGFDEEDGERKAEANRRFAAALATSVSPPNPALRWNPQVGPSTEVVTISREDAAARPDLRDVLEQALDRAGLDASERQRVREAMSR